MKIQKNLFFVFLIAALLVQVPTSKADVGPTYAIINCKIVPVTSPAIEKGVIIIRNGLIESLGPKEKVAIPEDAEIIEAEGLIAYPGLISAHTSLFLEPPKEEPPTPMIVPTETQEVKKGMNSDLFAFKLLKPKKSTIESYQRIGVTTVLVAPERGIFAGQSVLLNLNGEKAEAMIIKNPVALHINFATERQAYPSSLMGTMALLKQSFLDADYYSLCQAQFAKAPNGIKRLEYDPFLEALLPYAKEKKPIIFTCNNLEDIKRALRLIDKFKLNALLSGANEAWRVADILKKTKIPLLVTLNFKPPFTSIYINQGEELKEKAEKEIYPANTSNLYKEGIKFALTSYGLTEASSILKNIQSAVKAGLPKEEAIKALTINPAQFLGVNQILGSLEPGKIANVILTSGEVFEEKTQVEKVFVDGILFKIEKPPKEAKPSALNIAGSWKATISGPMGEMEMTVEIEQEGNEIRGFISSSFGKWEIRDGVLSGNDLSFTLAATIMGETMEMNFSGKAEKDTIEGTIAFAGGKAELRATRVPKGTN